MAALLVVLGCNTNAAEITAFNVGPYRLDMTNAEASRYGLYNCSQVSASARMECEARLGGEFAEYPLKLTFEPRTKRLVSVVLRLRNWKSDDPRIPAMRTALTIGACPAGSLSPKDNWYAKEDCYVRPDQYRWIRWDGGSEWRHQVIPRFLEIGATRNKKVVDNYYAK